MISRARRDVTALQRTVPHGKLQWLGKAAGEDYATFDGREYLVDGQQIGDPASLVEQPGQLFVSFPRDETDDRGDSMTVGSYLRRALPVPTGTCARLAAKDEARQADAAKRSTPRPVDVLRTLAITQPRGGQIFRPPEVGEPLTTTRQPDGSVRIYDRQALGLRGAATPAILTPERERLTTVREVIERMQAKGLVLVTLNGRLLPSPPGGRWPVGVKEACEVLEPLIVGILDGAPLPCSFRHPTPVEATTLLFPRVPACAEHLPE